jgi:hypothetical protein
MDLPTLDFSHFLTGNPTQQIRLANDLVASFKKHGFVKLINHGISEERIQELFSWVFGSSCKTTGRVVVNSHLRVAASFLCRLKQRMPSPTYPVMLHSEVGVVSVLKQPLNFGRRISMEEMVKI